MTNGIRFFWLAERIIDKYRWLSQDEREEVMAEAVFTAFIVPYPLSYSLMSWSVKRAIRMHCVMKPQYPMIPLHLVKETTWHIEPPEIREPEIINLMAYRKQKQLAKSA